MSIFRAEARLHKQQHHQNGNTRQTQHHIAHPGFGDLVESVVNLQEEVMRNTLKSQNVLEIDTKGLQSVETTDMSCKYG